MSGYVYAVLCCERIKIGWSMKPEMRFSKIASDSPFPCTFLGAWEGTREDEQAVHDQFMESRCHREWFAATAALMGFIEEKVPAADEEEAITISQKWEPKEGDSKLAIWRKSQRLTQMEVSEKIGVAAGMYSRWERGVCFPRNKHLSRLGGLLKGAVTLDDLIDQYLETRKAA